MTVSSPGFSNQQRSSDSFENHVFQVVEELNRPRRSVARSGDAFHEIGACLLTLRTSDVSVPRPER